MRTHSPWLLLPLAGCAVFPPEQDPVTAQRPTLSSDTATTAPGSVEVEGGVAIDPGDSYDTPLAVKWGAGPATELFAGWSPWQQVAVPGDDLEGSSDLAIGVRHRFLAETEHAPSAALQMVTSLPTGNDEVGSGEIDWFAAGIVTKRIETVTVTGFYQLGLLGRAGRGVDVGHDVALAAAGTIRRRWGWFGELGGQFVDDRDYDAVFAAVGATYAPRPSLVLDIGVVAGLSDDAPDVQFVFGVTQNLGRLFGGARRP